MSGGIGHRAPGIDGARSGDFFRCGRMGSLGLAAGEFAFRAEMRLFHHPVGGMADRRLAGLREVGKQRVVVFVDSVRGGGMLMLCVVRERLDGIVRSGVRLSVRNNGRLTHVQPIGADPKKFPDMATEIYGTGSFLLAGSEMHRMAALKGVKPIKVSVTNPGDFRRARETVEVAAPADSVVMDDLTSAVIPSQKLGKSLIFQVDLFSSKGAMPRTMMDVAARAKEIQYSSRTRTISDQLMQARKKREVVLRWLVERFTPEERYPEARVNELIAASHHDVETLRRELIGAGLMQRERGVYWRPASA